MKAQDYKIIKNSNENTSKVLTKNEVIWKEPKWWETAKNIANPKCDLQSNYNYFYLNKILLNNKNKNQIYVRWNESALRSLNKIDPLIENMGPAFYSSNNGKTMEILGGMHQYISDNTDSYRYTFDFDGSNLIRAKRLDRTEVVVETYCESNVQFNFWISKDSLGMDINRINKILGLFIAVK
ncbi:hypothetical protein QP531_06370 [Peptoniphilus harei]|uniref:hypothetical protein n=1 Tax=Peptoniphilus harei TaxID=54005 RepID=UPI00254BED9F|nr:hypothetical protein [Peptoniphilus harei]MDK7377440.1 hypothetical protein [Peptoniphilus harei]MDK7679753.1 hypothetical protein [Peptoniphilus harei]